MIIFINCLISQNIFVVANLLQKEKSGNTKRIFRCLNSKKDILYNGQSKKRQKEKRWL